MCRKKFVNSLLKKRMCEVSLAVAEPFWKTTSQWGQFQRDVHRHRIALGWLLGLPWATLSASPQNHEKTQDHKDLCKPRADGDHHSDQEVNQQPILKPSPAQKYNDGPQQFAITMCRQFDYGLCQALFGE
jgi:hypothetical protein